MHKSIQYLLAVLFFVLVQTSCCSQRRVVEVPVEPVSRLEATLIGEVTVRVMCSGGQGSGTVIGPKLILTAAHVVRDDVTQMPVQAVFVGSRSAHVVGYDVGSDLALLEIDGDFKSWMYAKVLERDVLEYEECISAGYPLGVQTPIVTHGMIQMRDDGGWVLHTSNATYGNSGGGLWVRDGQDWALIGVCQRTYVFDAAHGGGPCTYLQLACQNRKLQAFLTSFSKRQTTPQLLK